jgi:kynurenine formamidase
MKTMHLLLLLCASACALPRALHDRQWIDLTHTFDDRTIYWPTASGFELKRDSKGMTPGGYWYEANTLRTAEHGGTHLDAPVHFAENAAAADVIPVERFVGPAVVVDATAQCRAERDYEIRVEDLQAFEARHGAIPRGAIVLLRTDWSRRWPDAEAYLGTAARGQEAALQLHFPGLHPAAARWLATERAVDAVGIDTASIDHGPSRLFHSHRELFKRGIPVFENVANLDRLPAVGATVVALPMKIGGGSGGPLRIIASAD